VVEADKGIDSGNLVVGVVWIIWWVIWMWVVWVGVVGIVWTVWRMVSMGLGVGVGNLGKGVVVG
jgi:hypothetical protein